MRVLLPYDNQRGSGEPLNIAVAASHRRQRLGDKLMTHALSLAKSRGVKAVYLEVRESNTPARRLYEKYG